MEGLGGTYAGRARIENPVETVARQFRSLPVQNVEIVM